MIDIKALTESDKGRHVRYTDKWGHGIENGRITSWNDRYVFVRYYERIKPDPRPLSLIGNTSKATDPMDLEWIDLDRSSALTELNREAQELGIYDGDGK